MTIETATYIGSLNAAYPAATDQIPEGDDHIRLLKSTIKATFPNVSAAVTPVAADFNLLTGANAALTLTAPTLLNSWANSGGANLVAGYWKDAWGVVHMQGTITGGADGSIICTLPSGFRPTATVSLPVYASARSYGYVTIDSSGNVTAASVGVSTVSLGGIQFRTT